MGTSMTLSPAAITRSGLQLLHRPAESGPLVDPRWKEIDLPAGDHRLEGGSRRTNPVHAFRRRDVRISGVDVHTLHAPHGGGPALPGQMIQDRGQRLPVVPDQRLGRGVPRPVHPTVPQQDGAVGGQGNPGAVPSGHWMRWYCSMDRCVERLNGAEQGFFTRETPDLLPQVVQRVHLLPITTRSIEQYQRIQWPDGAAPGLP